MTDFVPTKDFGKLSEESTATVRKVLPNLPTKAELIALYREFKWGGDWGDFYEFTLYFNETEELDPRKFGTHKMRVDFNVDFKTVQHGILEKEDVRITYWGPVERYST